MWERIMRKRFHTGKVTASRPSQSTLQDVARAAGVSAATASRALNGNAAVARSLQSRVEAAAEALSYVPHASARALASRRTCRIACILPTIDNSIFARFSEALQRRIQRDQYGMMLSVTDFDEEIEARAIREVTAAGVDGIVLVGARRPREIYEFLTRRRLPFLLTNIFAPNVPYPQVGYDNMAGSQSVVRYLMDIGHKNFAAIDGPLSENDRAADRFRGVRLALAERGIQIEQNALIERRFTIQDGRNGFRTVMENYPDTTAVICGNDILAIGSLLEARSMGLRVPADISITGFDDLELASQLEISLTTVRVPMVEMGERAAETLLCLLRGQHAPQSTLVPISLVVRESTGAPREGAIKL
jgi:LacI family transcriptional regulator